MPDNDAAKKRAKATNTAALRAVVAGYLIYLGVSLIYELLQGRATFSSALTLALGLVFVASGAAFGLYTWRRWKAAVRAAEEEQDEPF